jgi:hypothetical protein
LFVCRLQHQRHDLDSPSAHARVADAPDPGCRRRGRRRVTRSRPRRRIVQLERTRGLLLGLVLDRHCDDGVIQTARKRHGYRPSTTSMPERSNSTLARESRPTCSVNNALSRATSCDTLANRVVTRRGEVRLEMTVHQSRRKFWKLRTWRDEPSALALEQPLPVQRVTDRRRDLHYSRIEPFYPNRVLDRSIADADRQLVADQSPAAPRQDGWAAGQTREVLLALAGGESPDAAAVRVDAPSDLGAARADRLTGGGCHCVRLGEGRTQGGRGVREMSSGTRRRTDAGPPGGRHHGAITATENVDRSAGSLAYHAADQ